jgi:hypothetical protein
MILDDFHKSITASEPPAGTNPCTHVTAQASRLGWRRPVTCSGNFGTPTQSLWTSGANGYLIR